MFNAADRSGCVRPRATHSCRVKLYLGRTALCIGLWVVLVAANALFPQSSLADPVDPAQSGMWSGTVPLPLVSVHAALLPGGKILMSDGQTLGASAYDWDPATNNIDS